MVKRERIIIESRRAPINWLARVLGQLWVGEHAVIFDPLTKDVRVATFDGGNHDATGRA